MLVFSTVAGAVSSSKTTKQLGDGTTDRDFTHTVLGEYGTATWCGYCKYAHGALKELYAEGDLDFYYVTLVCDMNSIAYSHAVNDYNLYGYPTLWWDGGYKVDVGAGSIPGAKATYTTAINQCGARAVEDIDIDLLVTWLSGTNMQIDVSVDNNEASTYGGHIRVYITEIESSMGWYDTAGKLYTFPFLDFAFNEPLSISAGGSWSDSTTWDGSTHGYSSITEDNLMVIAAVFNDEWHQGYSYPPSGNPFDAYYVDDAVGYRVGNNRPPNTPSNPSPGNGGSDIIVEASLSWTGGDPDWFNSVSYDLYFGTSSPPPLIVGNQSETTYDPPGLLDFDETYYWKIVSWDDEGASTSGPQWSFTTRGNDPPNTPSNPSPTNGETDVNINADLSWTGGDPDGDTVTYDVYFGSSSPPQQVVSNQSGTIYNPGILEFDKTYYWKIVSWDNYDATSEGSIWSFTTEENEPPNMPSDPDPGDGEIDVNVDADLSWTGGDPNPGDTVTYDVYFGTTTPPPEIATGISDTTYDPGMLDYGTIYYWKIVSWDGQNAFTQGSIWEFTTLFAVPDLDCSGTLSWTGVTPGSTVTGSFTVENNGDPESLLNWEVESYPEWGTWSFNPESGTGLEEGDTVTIDVEVIAPDEPETEFTGEVILVNSNDPDDTCIIDVSLATPVSQQVDIHPLFQRMLEWFPNAFPILRYLLGL